jgi:phosphinothricin acetyltransferase
LYHNIADVHADTACASAGFRQMIGYIDGNNVASLWLHKACGFPVVGYLCAVAFWLGEWTDTMTV